MMNAPFHYLFGPVPSRRFGLSLGVDLLPRKTCTLDCPFCEVGSTTHRTVERREYVPMGAVLNELMIWYASNVPADCVTLAGSGEPTLHTRFGQVLDFVRCQPRRLRSVLLTNSTLMPDPEVRAAAARADVVKITVSAWDQASFEAVTQPHADLRFEVVMNGLREFRRVFAGELWVEVFVLAGINDTPEAARAIGAGIAPLSPDKIHLNTAVRPTARQVGALSREALERLCPLVGINAEVVARFALSSPVRGAVDEDTVVAMIQRRPCTVWDVAETFGVPCDTVESLFQGLLMRQIITVEDHDRQRYYHAASKA